MLCQKNKPYFAKTFKVKLIAISDFGCRDSIIKNVIVRPHPVTPVITIADTSLVSSNLTGNQWYDINGMITGATNRTYTPTKPGPYYVITTANGCSSDTSNKYVINYPPDICMVTVDTATGKNLVVWERKPNSRIASYNVYKESTQAGIYQKLGNVPFSQLSVFVDKTSNPRQNADRYYLTSIDSLTGNETQNSIVHKTIHLTANKGASGEINLIWSHYKGFTFPSYVIYRGTNPKNIEPIDTVQSTVNSFSDLTPPTGVVFYQVVAVKPDTCYPALVRAQTSSGPYSQSLSNLKDYSLSTTPYLSVSPQQTSIGADSGSKAFINVYTNLSDWTISADKPWIVLSKDTAKDEITVVAKTNTSLAVRMAIISVSATGVNTVTILVVQDGASGISISEIKNSMNIYPNPTNGKVIIQCKLTDGSQPTIQLFDMNGKMIKQLEKAVISNNSIEMDLGGYKKGVYFIRLIKGEESYYSKVVVE